MAIREYYSLYESGGMYCQGGRGAKHTSVHRSRGLRAGRTGIQLYRLGRTAQTAQQDDDGKLPAEAIWRTGVVLSEGPAT